MRAHLAGCLLLMSLLPVQAQAPAPPADPVFVAAKSTFEALDADARRAIQRDLVWVGNFTGGATGEFGALTFAAIRRFETAQKTSVNGQLDAAERVALTKAANEARAAQGFRIETDKSSAMRIGVPTKLLTKRAPNAAGLDRWQDQAEKITLDLQAPKGEETLEILFEKGTDPKVTTRKINYKLLRPDFFVIAGETAGGKFYRRIEKGTDGQLRGFSIGYDKAQAKTVDPLVIAIASTFEAFPSTRPAPSQVAATPGTAPAAAAVSPPAPPKPRRVTGVVVAEGKIVTALASISACKSVALDGPARMLASIAKRDEAGGLALVATATPRTKALSPSSAALSNGVLLQRDSDGKLLAAPAELAGSLVLAPVQEGGAGAALFSQNGAWSGMIISEPVARYAVAGTLPVLRHRAVSADVIARFAEVPVIEVSNAARSTGDIAAEAGAGVVSLICAM